MKIDESTIKKLAGLSKLEFSKEEMKLITEDMTKMVDFINKLDSNTNLLCFTNGVIDFKEKTFRKGHPDDYISKSTNIYTSII